MASYFDKVLYLYPNIQHVMYWQTQYDGKPWNDPYDGLKWNNTEIPKPTKEELDALDDAAVEDELDARKEIIRKNARNQKYASDLTVKSNYDIYKQNNPDITFSEYLDYLESVSAV
jgi:hypothetical protein